jgi:O-antigen ligase
MLYIGVLIFLLLQYLRPQEWPAFRILAEIRLVFFLMILLGIPWLFTLQRKKLLRTPEDVFMVLLWLATIASWWAWWKSRMYEPAQEFGRVLIAYLFVAHVVDSRGKLLGTLWMTMLMLVIVGMTAGENVGLRGQYASIGMFNNRNDFAYAMSMMLPVALAFILRGGTLERIAGLGCGIVGVIEIINSESRGGLLAMCMSALAVFYVVFRSKYMRRFMIVVGIMAMAAAMKYDPGHGAIGDWQSDKSAMGRVEMWARALELFERRPMFGHGYLRFKETAKIQLGGRVRDTHSSYMEAIAETGGFGLFAYIGLLFYGLYHAYKISQETQHPKMRLVALAMTGVLAGQACASAFQSRTYHMFVLVQVALVSAMRLVHDREMLEAGGGEGLLPSNALEWEADQSRLQPHLYEASLGSGFLARGAFTRREALIAGGLTIACYISHKLFCMSAW